MKAILSTRILTAEQKSMIPQEQIDLIEYNAIEIAALDFEIKKDFDNYIFSSQNAVTSFLKVKMPRRNCYCVGDKTKALLEKNGQKVVKTAENAQILADFIAINHKSESFLFFCGNLRRPELGETLKAHKVQFQEVEVYQTRMVSEAFDRAFDAILFFSPSGVQSFIQANKIGDALALCIGPTTAAEAKKFTNKVRISSMATVEAVLELLSNQALFSGDTNTPKNQIWYDQK